MIRRLPLLLPIAFLAAFFFYPLGSILQLSLVPDGRLDLGGFERLVSVGYLRGTLWFTVWQAALSTVLTLALAIPGAHVFARYEFPGKAVLLALATLPFVLPTVVVAVAFTALIGPRSTLNHLLMDIFNLEIRLQRTLTLIFIAHVFYNYAIALRIISSFWATQNQRVQEAARMLGASPLTTFRRVTLPMLTPAIAAAGTLVYIFCFTSFGVILLLGGARHATLEVEIYQQSLALFNLPLAGALALAQLLATLLMMIAYTRLQRHMTQPIDLAAARTLTKHPEGWRERGWVGVNLLVIAVLILAPLVALVERAFTVGMDGPSLRYFSELTKNPRESIIFVPPIEALGNSLQIAAVATVFALILGTLAVYLLNSVRWLDPVFMLPLATSAVTLGFGFIIALDEPPLNLRDSFWILPIAHTLIGMPFVVRSILPSLRGIRPSVREAASVMGASDLRRWWRIDLPLIGRGLLVGATFAFTISMGEFGAAVFIARGREPTMPIVIFRLLGEPGIVNFGQALAMSAILMGVCGLGFLLIGLLNRAIIGEF